MHNTYTNFIGIDIGKFEFVMNINGIKRTYVYTNDTDGLNSLYSEHCNILEHSLVVLETTGGYERYAIAFLQQHNIAVHRANGRQIKSFIRSHGIIGKSDSIDAIALSQYAKERHDKLELYKHNNHEFLRELNERREDLVKMRAQEKNRIQAPSAIVLHDSFIAIRKVLDEQIAALNQQIAELIESDYTLQLKAKVLQTIPGVGKVTANAMLAQFPELGTLNQKQIASLAGVAPHPNQSGTKQGYRRTKGGRRSARPMLFMAALSASRSTKNKLGEFYNRLIENGKKPMCAIVAVMRKIMVIANARIKESMDNIFSGNSKQQAS